MTPIAPPPPETVSPWYSIQNKAETKTADVYIYDAIGGWFGVAAGDFVRDIAALDVTTINLYVNSPGGSVFDGMAIMNALRRHKANVIATVDGLAASAASFIIQAADEIVMGRGAELMIHDALAICLGNAEDMTTMARDLDRVSTTIASLYAERAGGTTDFWRTAMRAETWYTADEAVEAGLADRVVGTDRDESKDQASNVFDLSMFAHAGRRDAPDPAMPPHTATPAASISAFDRVAAILANHKPTPTPPSPAEPVDHHKKGADTMSDALMKGIRDRLGVPAEAELDDDGVLAALDEALAEQAEQEPAATAPTTTPDGTVLLDASEHERLLAEAKFATDTRAEQAKTARENAVEAAVSDGRIPPSRRDHWVAQLEKDPGAQAVLDGLAKGLIPTASNGYTGGIEENPDEPSTLYSTLYPTNAKEA